MIIEQIYTGCLAQGAYYIESNGEAIVIDPLREVEPYIERAKRSGAKIKYVLETHFHADFVSGHIDLAKKSGAKIVYGPMANPDFEAHIAADNEILEVGKLKIKVLHTPGHTMESTCYLLSDENGNEKALFSGDTLFIGDVGRPDLAQKAAHLSQEELAATLFDSLRSKVMTLNDDIVVYPAHGAGSACGKNMSKETSDTLGNQKRTNYALRAEMTKDEFVKEVTDGLMAPPAYFPMNVKLNKEGYESIDIVRERGATALDPEAFELLANESGSIILDTRNAQSFASGFIPNSINIGIDGGFAPWVGTLIPDVKQNIMIVADPGREEEVVTRLARVGFDQCLGFLKGGFESWRKADKEIDQIESITADQLANLYSKNNKLNILDVRKQSEYNSEHIQTAMNGPLDTVNDSMLKINQSQPTYVHCAGGYRSMTFISILKARGYENLIDVKGGFGAIKANGSFDLTDYVCPTTLV